MSTTFQREPRLKVGMTLRRDQHVALRQIATDERHDNLSLIVQRAIDREIERVEAERGKAYLADPAIRDLIADSSEAKVA